MVKTKDKVAHDVFKETQAAASLIASLNTDDEELRHDMVEGETGLFEAIEAAINLIDDCEATIAGCKDREAVFADRRRNAERRRDSVRALVEQAMAMAEIKTMKLPSATLTLKEVPPKPLIDDEALIPARFWKQPPPVLDRAAINQAIKDGETVDGVTKTNGTISVQIRRA